MSIVLDIRIIAPSREEAERARAYLLRISDGRVALQPPRLGRKGTDWIIYGTVRPPADGGHTLDDPSGVQQPPDDPATA